MKNLVIVFSSIVLIACGTKGNDVESVKNTAAHSEEVEEGLSLDGGKKWIVNSETHEGMTQIKVILDNMDPLMVGDYNQVGEKCDEQTSYIISNCSMKGEAHNQLHHVLHPILDDIENLKKSTSVSHGKVAANSLEENISAYFAHFELQ